MTEHEMRTPIPRGSTPPHRTALCAAAVLAASWIAATAQTVTFHLAPDVPTDLSATTFLPWEIVRRDGASEVHSSSLVIPGDPALDALHRMEIGDWLFSVKVPTDLGGITYGPSDIIRYDGNTFSLFRGAAAMGIPAGSNLDSLFLAGGDTGDPVVGFDVPTALGAVTYQPADLARHTGAGFTVFFDATAAGVPAGSDATGAALRGGDVVLTFDVPTDLGGTTYLPGDLVRWVGTGFALLHGDPNWPAGSVVFGFSLLPPPGIVPPTLSIAHVGGDVVTLSWEASCSAGATDYAIYEGEIGNWYSHSQVDCQDDAADRTETITSGPGNRYFLVVPHNAPNDEGGYGVNSAGATRPRGLATCVPTQQIGTCG